MSAKLDVRGSIRSARLLMTAGFRSLAFHLLPSFRGQRSECALTENFCRVCPNRVSCRKVCEASFGHLTHVGQFLRNSHSKMCLSPYRPLDKGAQNPVGEFWTPRHPSPRNLADDLRRTTTNFAPPEESFAPRPGRNSDNFAPPPHANQ